MKKIVLLFSVLVMIACKNQNAESTETEMVEEETEMTMEAEETEMEETSQEMYAPATNDDQMAANITNFLVNDYLKNDLNTLTENDRKFQFYKIDLNGDGKDEYFVRFMSSYFCGSGGCTMLLLDHESNVITKFTVMEPPVFAEKEMVNGWKMLLVRSGGELKMLTYNNGTYPSNPSVAEKAPFDAASGSAIDMFNDDFMASKTYTF